MRIAFDAKRALLNNTGLGNYSRRVIDELSESAPYNEYILYTPRAGDEAMKRTNPRDRLFDGCDS